MSKYGGQIGDHVTTALEHVDQAEEWANRDGNMDRDHRNRMIDKHLRLAQIHATLSVSQQVNLLNGGRVM